MSFLAIGARPAGQGGWIGYWAPGIGDPSLMGWVTVLLYFVAGFVSCWVGWKKLSMTRSERVFWWGLGSCLLLLGVNKQLDLQTAFTELGRIVAAEQGWYEHRRRVQRFFILAVGLGALGAGGALLFLIRRSPFPTYLAMLGALALVAFVVIRASSMHHVDLIIRADLWGMRGNWIIEIGGISIVLLGGLLRWFRPTKKGGA